MNEPYNRSTGRLLRVGQLSWAIPTAAGLIFATLTGFCSVGLWPTECLVVLIGLSSTLLPLITLGMGIACHTASHVSGDLRLRVHARIGIATSLIVAALIIGALFCMGDTYQPPIMAI
jgi:hypothetical protein